jgi:hypothetical protein
MAVWLAILTLVCLLVYLDLVGLPEFAKRPLLQQLRDRGLNLEFSRLRLDLYHGLVADNVRFNRPKFDAEPLFTAKEVTLHPDLRALAGLKLQVDSLALRHARIEWPTNRNSGTLSTLDVEDIEARLRLLPGDEWSLDQFEAKFAHAKFSVSGNIRNASALAHWKLFEKKGPAEPGLWQRRLQRIADVVAQLSFSPSPELHLIFSGDAHKPESFNARLSFEARDARTPWGGAGKLSVLTVLNPGDTNEPATVKVQLDANAVRTAPGSADRIQVRALLSPGSTNQPLSAEVQAEAFAVSTEWGGARKISFTTTIASNTAAPEADPAYGYWVRALPWNAGWKCDVTALTSKQVSADAVSCGGLWIAPKLAITNLSVAIGRSSLMASARLDASSRALSFDADSNIDPRALESLLTLRTRVWLSSFAWLSAPHFRAGGSLILPSWTNREPDWRGEVRPTLQLAGQFAGTNVAYRGVQAHWAKSHFSYTNLVWRLPDLQVRRPEGTLFLSHQENDETKDYHWHIRGPVDPRALQPLLDTNQLRVYEIVSITNAVYLDGDVWGRLYEYERIGCRMNVAVTNFAVRGHEIDSVQTEVCYTNRVLELLHPNLERGAQLIYADGIAVNFDEQRIYFTNGFSMADPQMVTDAIGPKVHQAIEPYHFLQPPVAHVNGYVPMHENGGADLQVSVEGGPFEWWKFKVPEIAGEVRWKGKTLLLTNVQVDFYEGSGDGSAFFNFDTPGKGADFNFTVNVSNANLHALMLDLGSHSNRLEGSLTGTLIVTDARTTNWHSWNGYGNAGLTNGFLWDMPLFGVFSPILDGLIPGLGNSRATEATAWFTITNGVVFSDSLNIRSTMMRLQYEGTVDFDGRVNARVEAELLRDTWFIGRLISLAFKPVTKLLEYRVTGTLSKPKPEPLYFLPRLLMLPLHPIKTLEELLPSSNSSSSSTNAPSTPKP